ncbi:MAG: hypothetical protein QM831_32715 [Kofleriaceae bacterium]
MGANVTIVAQADHTIRAEIAGRAPLVGCVLSDGDTTMPARIVDVREQPVAMVVLVSTSLSFAGASWDDQPENLKTDLEVFRASFDHTQWHFAPHSEIELLGYGTGVKALHRWQPFGPFGDSFGKPTDYVRQLGNDLATGIDQALLDLRAKHGMRKVLVIYGDGSDTDVLHGNDKLLQLDARVHADQVETYALTIATELSSDTKVIQLMVDDPVAIASQAEVATGWQSLLARVDERQAFEFRGDALAWDGQKHTLVFDCANQVHTDAVVQLPLDPPPPPGPSWPRRLLVLGLIALAAGIAWDRVIRWTRR